MADKPFDRVVINVRERPLSSDIVRESSEIDRTVRFLARQMLARRTGGNNDAPDYASGFINTGFMVLPSNPAAMSVVVKAGLGFLQDAADVPSDIGGIVGLNDLDSYKPLLLLTDQTIAVPAADPVNPRIDIVEVKANRAVGESASRDIFDTVTEAFVANLVNKNLGWGLDALTSINGSSPINYKTGTPAGAPATPATDAGYVKVGEVHVAALAATLPEDKVVDTRRMLYPGGMASATFAVTMNGTGSVLSMDYYNGPPGTRLFALWDNVFGQILTLQFCAGTIRNAQCQIMIQQAPPVTAKLYVPMSATPAITTPTFNGIAAPQNFNNAALYSPARLVASANQSAFFQIGITKQAAGVTSAPADPADYPIKMLGTITWEV